jgi:peptidoglycan hydrolase CwlO-like protein
MGTCSQTNIPILNQQEDPCNGIHTSTNCIFYPEAITYLFIDPNEDLTAIIQAMVLSLQSNNTRTTQLEEENAVQAAQILVLQGQVLDLQNAMLDAQTDITNLQGDMVIAQTDITNLQGIVNQLQLTVAQIQLTCCP